MKQLIKKRLVALICIISLLCPLVFNGMTSRVDASSTSNLNENSDTIMVDSLKEQGYESWTLADLGIADQTFASGEASYRELTRGSFGALDMNKIIFSMKMEFPKNGNLSVEFGNVANSRRFRINSSGTGIQFRYIDVNNTLLNETLSSTKAKVNLVDNQELEISISVEYGARYVENNVSLVDMKVGVFFNGKLYNNEFFTVKKAQQNGLNVNSNKLILFGDSGGTGCTIKSNQLWEADEVALKAQGYDYWTLADWGIADQTYATGAASYREIVRGDMGYVDINKTIFSMKMEFPTSGNLSVEFGNVGNGRRFRLNSSGNGIQFRYIDVSGTLLNETLSSSKAKVNLVDNKELTISISVEYGARYVENNVSLVDMKVGVFFNGKLYNNQYFTVKKVQQNGVNENSKKLVIFGDSGGTGTTIKSNHLWEADEVALQAEGYDFWTLADISVNDQTIAAAGTVTTQKIAETWNKNIFTAKLEYPTTDFAAYEIGYADGMHRFRIQSNGTDGVRIRYIDNDSTGMDQIFNTATAGVVLRGNKNLTTSISVEFTNEYTENGVAYVDMKIGVFFNGKLYNDQYFTATKMRKDYAMSKGVSIGGSSASTISIASHKLWEREVSKLREKDYEYWTLADWGIVDQTFASGEVAYRELIRGDMGYADINKTIFTMQMEFPTNGNLSVEYGNVGNSRRFRLNSSGSGIQFRYIDVSGTLLNETLSSSKAKVNLVDNKELTISISVEYGARYVENDVSLVDMKVGVFFNGKLYNNQYFTVKKVQQNGVNENSKKLVIFGDSGGTGTTIKSNHLWEADEVALKATGFEYWTLADVGMSDKTTRTDETQSSAFRGYIPFDKTIFTGNLEFMNGVGSAYEIGYGDGSYRFRLDATDANTIRVRYMEGGTAKTTLSCDSLTAGAKLVGNSNLSVSISVEYTNEYTTDSVEYVDMRVGVFFNGRLFNNQYVDVTGVQKDRLFARCFLAYNNKNELNVSSNYLWDLPERELTFRDLKMEDGAFAYSDAVIANEGNDTKTRLENVVIQGIAKFYEDNQADSAIVFGGLENAEKGIALKHTKGSQNLSLVNTNTRDEIVTFDATTAGVTLVGKAFDFKLSIHRINDDMKVGVWFGDKLYGDTYYTIQNYGAIGPKTAIITDGEGTKVRIASERIDASATPEIYDLTEGEYTLAGQDNIVVTVNNATQEYADEITLTKPGEYLIKTCDAIYTKFVLLFVPGDTHSDGVVNVKDLVAAKKTENKALTDIQSKLLQVSMNLVDDDKLDQNDTNCIREILLGTWAKKKVIEYQENVMPIAGYYGPYSLAYAMSGKAVYYDSMKDEVFQAISDAGFNLILQNNVDYATNPKETLLALSYADKYNLNMYIKDSRTNNVQNTKELANYLKDYQQFNSFKGISVVDEPTLAGVYGVGDEPRLMSDYYNSAKLVNGTSNLVGYANLFAKGSTLNLNSNNSLDTAYANYLEQYTKGFDAKVLTFDYYPWLNKTDAISYNATQQDRFRIYFDSLTDTRQKALDENITMWSFVQAGTNWNDQNVTDMVTTNDFPVQAQLLWSVNTSLAYGAKGIQYFPLVQPYRFSWEANNSNDYDRNGIIGADGSKTPFYESVKNANGQIATVDDVLMNSVSKRILAEGGFAKAGTGITNNDFNGLLLSGITVETETVLVNDYPDWQNWFGKKDEYTEYGAIVGVFDYQGKEAYYVVNFDYGCGNNDSQKVRLNFKNNQTFSVISDGNNCTNTIQKAVASSYELNLKPGGAALVVVE